ncbi:TatD family hydrolase [Ferrimonas balearica]|uniref:TatD family hydrolase n=1 Tax=Ferrimonas balearica TaxID=44012 RepID=UPI001C999D3A|nr:TatD family hydrolase [Ferrimonas balearica]MBY5921885.1 TatD family hydrolase [Ferrimonas balearica]MBY5994775.1 TatD family hydrolase [Ferrimonas balearica]
MLIDSHCHLDLPAFDEDRDAVLTRAKKGGVGALIVPAVDRHNWDAVTALAGQRQGVRIGTALGLHPCFTHQAEDIEALAERLASQPELVAVGECGLDAVSGAAPMPEQLRLCEAQLALARQHQLPVILHVRKAHNEMLTLLARHPLLAGGVVHGFSGSLVQAQQYWRRGFHLGVGGVITYPRANKTRQALAQVPVEALLLETDSPDMPLNGYQGQRNEPARVASVLTVLAELRQCDAPALGHQLTLNAERLFFLP